MTDDGDISRRYRELAREEPPRHLDDAIRAAARRAVGTRPAPLVVPTGRQRWYFPLAAAAVIVLAVAVTLHVEREQPGEELVTAPAEKPKAEEKAAEPQPVPQPERRRKTESADARELPDVAPPRELQKDAIILEQNAQSAPAPQAAPPPPPLGAAGRPVPAPPRASAELRRSEEGARAPASVSAYALQSPEQWLQGIADLRRQGRHEEADKSLAEFRKRFPDYRISKEVLEQLEKR
jgi:hypothetical protein